VHQWDRFWDQMQPWLDRYSAVAEMSGFNRCPAVKQPAKT